MIEFDGISFNELISRRIMGELASHDPNFSELAQDQVPNRVTRYSFMAAIAKIKVKHARRTLVMIAPRVAI